MNLKAQYNDGILSISHLVEEGGWIVKVAMDGMFMLYEVPQYGGLERYEGTYDSFHDAYQVAKKWT